MQELATKKQAKISSFMQTMRNRIVSIYESFEPSKRFEIVPWDYKNGIGGGQIARIRGKHFEKAACNFSALHGDKFPADDAKGPFFATGVSTITHMKNPKAPTFHFNIRYIETSSGYWIGGGFDMTPMGFFFDRDTALLHSKAKSCLDAFDTSLYPQFSENARRYFFLPHRQKERGVGGVFFDHFTLGSFEEDQRFLEAITSSYIDAVQSILPKRLDEIFTSEDKALQNKMRAHYVEFNLIYDRGTRFGFQSGGNHEAILCSMPPTATW